MRSYKKKASKTIVWCEASSKFQRTSFQKDRFVRGFFEISQHKLAKRAFRAMLPTIFTEKASKTIVSCEASRNASKDCFVRGFFETSQNNLPKRAFRARLPPNFMEQSFQNERFARCFREFPQKICVSPQFNHQILRESSSSKTKMSVSLQRRAIPHFKIHVSLQRRAQKYVNPAQEPRGNTRHTKITILPQFRTSDEHEVTRGLQNELQNLDVR